MKKSNLMIVTLGRVDWNIWHPILKILKGNKNLKLIVCAAGMHFEKSLGESFNEIKKDKIHIDHRIKLDPLKKKEKINYILLNSIVSIPKNLLKFLKKIILII